MKSEHITPWLQAPNGFFSPSEKSQSIFQNLFLFIWLHPVLAATCVAFHCGAQASL